ncbi:polyamine ABC transporter ATP-binding protein [Mangrovimicrobium sediminis]|uniref:Spermidine/putrescine import ATP-binding protein PotA n=1 Tax=Mangrovimicrobium sediminis TaxID=2562682 RepID=A0A4Z0LVN8_9GAMM|nr:polyamine ABC transporter ATP-binding protein [Haliea sp. SAOS-164]TGD71125.1 polyamine ABC transporter ATP-binding protein [Haliea sp. SAOS-164]
MPNDVAVEHSDSVTPRVKLAIRRVTKDYDGFKAVDDVSLEIRQGEIFALLGASGCGKSTLLRMLAGFETPTEGEIYLDGTLINRMPAHERPINMMFQSYALFPHMSVEQNIAFGLKYDRLAKPAIRDKVQEVLGLVRMTDYAKRKPHQLSGGQQQRVALARSLAKEPKLLLLDEPMGALDKKLRTQMQLEIVDIIEEVGVTCVMVTHDQEEAMTMASRVGIMDAGVIRQVGPPHEVYEQPNCRMTAEFIGSVNIFEGTLAVDEADHVEIASPALALPLRIGHGITGSLGMALAVAVRPEKIRVSREAPAQPHNAARGKVVDIAYLGSHSILHIALPGDKVVIASVANTDRSVAGDDAERFTWNDEVHISWSEHAGVVLTS